MLNRRSLNDIDIDILYRANIVTTVATRVIRRAVSATIGRLIIVDTNIEGRNTCDKIDIEMAMAAAITNMLFELDS